MKYILVETEFDYFNLGTTVKPFDNAADCYAEYLKRKEQWNEHFNDYEEVEMDFREGPLVNENDDEVDCMIKWVDEESHYMIQLEIFEVE